MCVVWYVAVACVRFLSLEIHWLHCDATMTHTLPHSHTLMLRSRVKRVRSAKLGRDELNPTAVAPVRLGSRARAGAAGPILDRSRVLPHLLLEVAAPVASAAPTTTAAVRLAAAFAARSRVIRP